jgi:hypothetical protein
LVGYRVAIERAIVIAREERAAASRRGADSEPATAFVQATALRADEVRKKRKHEMKLSVIRVTESGNAE